jgi:hypothetical protein
MRVQCAQMWFSGFNPHGIQRMRLYSNGHNRYWIFRSANSKFCDFIKKQKQWQQETKDEKSD